MPLTGELRFWCSRDRPRRRDRKLLDMADEIRVFISSEHDAQLKAKETK